MRFENRANIVVGSKSFPSTKVQLAIATADRLLDHGSEMLMYTRGKTDWQYDVDFRTVAIKLATMPKKPIPIELYYPNKNSAQTASWDGKTISISAYYHMRAENLDMVGSLVHEWCHAVGFHHQDKGWWGSVRRNYWSLNKSKYSVPYHLSDNIGLWI